MVWRELDVDAGFGGGEETMIFGPRNEKGSSLYQVDTLACVSPKEEEPNGRPSMNSIASQDGICLVISNNVLLFDESCSTHKVSFSFESQVDCIALTADGRFLAVGERSGILNLAHVPSKRIIFSQSLFKWEDDETQNFKSLMFCEIGEGIFELEALPDAGSMTRVANLNLNSLNKAISDGNVAAMKEMHDQLTRDSIDLSSVHNDSLNHITTVKQDVMQKLLVSGQGENGISVWERGMDGQLSLTDFASDFFDQEIGFRKCIPSPNGDFFIALDTQHHISIWSTALLTPIAFWEDIEVNDVILYSGASVGEDGAKRGSAEELKMVILTKPENKKSLLQVYSLPNFEHVYTLQVSGWSRLADVQSQLDAIYFIEGVEDELKDDSYYEEADNNNDEMDISTVRLRCLTEALPESRFLRLLYKKKFDQAEEFAKQFDLEIELVYCVKASAILNRISPWGDTAPKTEEDYEQAIKELKSCLDKINDAAQIINCCLHAELPTLHATYDLLKYAKDRLDSKAWSSVSNTQMLLDGLNRLVTFQVAFGAKNFSVATWKPFLSASLLDEVINCFHTDVTAGIVIWRRHQPELEPGFTLDKLETLLGSIPESVPSSKIIQWLREDFVPFVLTKLPDGQMLLAKWLEERASNMEVSEKEFWPNNALELAEVMFKAFSDVAKTTYGRGHATPAQFAMQVCKLTIPCSAQDEDLEAEYENSLASTMAKLADLVTCLREISALHSQFACKLSLHCYKKENTKTIAFRLLDRVLAAELIPSTFEKYVIPYAVKHNLVPDDLLLNYVEDLVDRKSGIGSSLWLSKVIAIIECITGQQSKCSATLKVMSTAVIPWNSEVQRLVDSMMKAHPDNEDLKQQYQFAELKTTMMQYGIRNYKINAEGGLDTIHCIFSSDSESACSDAMQAIKTFHLEEAYVYFFRLKSWITRGKIEECCELLRSLDVQLALECGQKIVSWAITLLEDEPLDQEDEEQMKTNLKASIEIMRTLSSIDADFKSKHADELSSLKCLSALQIEFGIFISLEKYKDEATKHGIWKDFLTSDGEQSDTPKEDSNGESGSKWHIKSVRLADLLGFDDISRQKEEISLYCNQGEIRQILKILRAAKSGIPTKRQLDLFEETLLYLLTEKWHQSSDVNLHQWLTYIDNAYRLACFATSVCAEDDLLTYLEISRLLRLAVSVAEQCESTDYQQDAFRQTDIYAKWNLTDRYEDDGMVLNSHEIIPLLKKFSKACLQDTQNKRKYESHHLSGAYARPRALQDLGEANQEIMKLLQDNNLQVLALEYNLQAISTGIQHTATVNMGYKVPSCYEEQMQSNQELFIQLLPFASKTALDTSSNLLIKVLTHRHVDHDFALGYLCTLPNKCVLETMNALKERFGTKYKRMEAASLIGVDYAKFGNDQSLLKTCQILQDGAYWGKKFASLKISCKDVYRLVSMNFEEKRTLLQKLVSNPNADISTMLKFCKTFSYDEDSALLLYINTLLTTSRSTKSDLTYKEKVLEAMQMVESCENLFTMLHSCLKKISPYDYERLYLVLGQMNELKPDTVDTMISLLDCLSCYQRCAQPLEYELSYLTHTEDEQLLRGSANILPESAKTRLPFHPLLEGQPWKILSPELKSETMVRKLENIAKCIKFDPDQLYTTAIHNIVNNHLQLEQKGNEKNAKEFKFQIIKGLLHSVGNSEMAIAAAKWVAKLLPTGEEKVKSLKACVDLCKQLEKTCGESELQKVQDWTRRLSDLCKRIEVEAVLSKYGILDEDYKSLSQQPAALICKLYEDFGCKAEIVNGRVVGIPNIHSLAEEIAKINRSSILKIHVYLLEKWLPSCNKCRTQDGDTTMQLDISMVADYDDSKDDENNLRRVIYILNNSNQMKNAEFLLHFAFKESSSKITHTCRIRALQALFTLVSVTKIEAIAARPLDEIRHYLTSLIYLAELEELHLPQTQSAFTKCNKEGLVKGLWRNHSHEPKGVRLIADLCMDYKIYDPQLWNILLPQLLNFGMKDYLRHTLVVLSGIPELREIPCLAKMWKEMILTPFSTVMTPLSEEDENLCIESGNLLQRCPVMLHLNIQDIAGRYYKIGMYTHALSCLSLIPDANVRDQSIQELLKDVSCFSVLDQISEERKRGRLDGHLDHVEAEIFCYINEHKMYKEIYQSGYFQAFVHYLITTDQLNGLLMQTLASGRIKNAIQLVEVFNKNQLHSMKRTKTQDLKGSQLLMVYLQDHNLFEEAIVYIPDIEETHTGLSSPE